MAVAGQKPLEQIEVVTWSRKLLLQAQVREDLVGMKPLAMLLLVLWLLLDLLLVGQLPATWLQEEWLQGGWLLHLGSPLVARPQQVRRPWLWQHQHQDISCQWHLNRCKLTPGRENWMKETDPWVMKSWMLFCQKDIRYGVCQDATNYQVALEIFIKIEILGLCCLILLANLNCNYLFITGIATTSWICAHQNSCT